MAGFLILSIETSTGCGSVALTLGNIEEGRLVTEFTHRPDVTHSRRLLGSIKHIMTTADVTWEQLDAVAVSYGPGSFTGLRIGMAAAKGIAMAAAIPVLGVASLDGLAMQCIETTRQVCCVLDARKGQVYGAFYRYDSTARNMQRQGAIEALTPEELMQQIHEPTVLAGPGIKPYQDFFLSMPMLKVLPETCIQPRASSIGFLGAEQLQKSDIPPPGTLTPFYARASEAEINTQKKKIGK